MDAQDGTARDYLTLIIATADLVTRAAAKEEKKQEQGGEREACDVCHHTNNDDAPFVQILLCLFVPCGLHNSILWDGILAL